MAYGTMNSWNEGDVIKSSRLNLIQNNVNDVNTRLIAVEGSARNSNQVDSQIDTKINALDVSAITGSTIQTITSISETDGKISATYSDIAIASKNQFGLVKVAEDNNLTISDGVIGVISSPTFSSITTALAGENALNGSTTIANLTVTKFTNIPSYTTNNKNYAVQIDNETGALYVNVPWTDTTYSAGTGLSLSNTVFNHTNSVTAASKDLYKIAIDAQGHVSDYESLSLATVATSGSYNDLLNKPTLGTVAASNVLVLNSGEDLADVSGDNTDIPTAGQVAVSIVNTISDILPNTDQLADGTYTLQITITTDDQTNEKTETHQWVPVTNGGE